MTFVFTPLQSGWKLQMPDLLGFDERGRLCYFPTYKNVAAGIRFFNYTRYFHNKEKMKLSDNPQIPEKLQISELSWHLKLNRTTKHILKKKAKYLATAVCDELTRRETDHQKQLATFVAGLITDFWLRQRQLADILSSGGTRSMKKCLDKEEDYHSQTSSIKTPIFKKRKASKLSKRRTLKKQKKLLRQNRDKERLTKQLLLDDPAIGWDSDSETSIDDDLCYCMLGYI